LFLSVRTEQLAKFDALGFFENLSKNQFSLDSHHHHHHHHLFSFRRSVQDYKIQMDMEIVTIWGKQEVKPLQGVYQ
jgi:Fe2+ or Zn2+ uptake regulation protein